MAGENSAIDKATASKPVCVSYEAVVVALNTVNDVY
jgi:hypothetical protein